MKDTEVEDISVEAKPRFEPFSIDVVVGFVVDSV